MKSRVYDHAAIERKWQKKWGKSAYKTTDTAKGRDNFYLLTEFPYPSGNLHVGHWYAFAVPDILARYLRMKGKNVLFPIGFDAFGLPAENAALKRGLNPRKWTEENIAYMRTQLLSMGASFDWSREVKTCDPAYYRWTQWLFLQLYKKGLVYRKQSAVNWCPSCKTVLANEQVKDEKCERCGTAVEQKQMEQWNVKITDYAERLLAGLEKLDWPEEIKAAQRNWIGKSEGAEIEFRLKYNPSPALPKGKGEHYGYYSTNASHFRSLHEKAIEMRENPTEAEQKLWGALKGNRSGFHFRQQHIIGPFIVDFTCLSHSLVIEVDGDIHDLQKERDAERSEMLRALGFQVLRFSNIDVAKDTTGVVKAIISRLQSIPESKALPFGEGLGGVVKVFTTRPDTIFSASFIALAPTHPLAKEAAHIKAVNPANGEELPVFVADYVLDDYGTGAIMGVPAHDERDWLFAKERGLSIREVMIPYRYYKPNPPREGKKSVTRRNVHAIVRNPQTGKILALRWKKFPWTTFPMGGIDNGEDIVEAARREVREETGYKNLLPVRILGGQVKAEYFAAHKDENRISFTSAVLFDLRDEEREKVDAEESDKHEVFWMNQSDMKPEIMTHAELDVWLSRLDKENSAYTGDGVLINSGKFSGMTSAEAKQKITESVGGKMTTSYKLRDWTVSRQRYWGVPIPVVQCKKCGYVPVKEKDLPVELPEIKDYKPTGDGKSPLAKAEKWKRVKCPQCGGLAERETDTLDTFVDSSWYFLRYTDPKNKKVFASSTKMKNWLPVNFYSGGAEHTTMHLLYSRFWHKALYDCGLVVDTEPYVRRLNRGLIMGPDGQKMSKSRGNVIDPDAEVARLGADTVRLYLAFIGPYNETGNYPWNPQGAIGVRRFLERVWRLGQNFYSESDKREAKRILQMSGASGRSEATRAFPRTLQNAISRSALLHQTIKKVGEAIETFKMNTGVSALMILLNEFEKQETVSGEDYKIFLRLLAPFAPHLAEELWAERGQRTSIHKEPWPLYDPKRAESERVTVVVQVDGRVRGSFQAERGLAEADALLRAKTIPDIAKHLIGKTPSKHIYIPDRLINIVAE